MSSSPTSDAALFLDVSDTARWVAHYRALEAERPDSIVRDPFARRLAGPRGRLIAEALPELSLRWMIPVRARIYDELLFETLARGNFTAVLNLAAGFDTRPYRLELPAKLRFIEADCAHLLAEKTRLLAGERPRTALERLPLDLTDTAACDALLARLATEQERVLVLTEGVLAYLDEAAVSALSRSLHAAPAVSAWIVEAALPEVLARAHEAWGAALARGNATMKFAPVSGIDFFAAQGWRAEVTRSLLEEAERFGREMRFAPLARAVTKWLRGPDVWRRMAMYAVLIRQAAVN